MARRLKKLLLRRRRGPRGPFRQFTARVFSIGRKDEAAKFPHHDEKAHAEADPELGSGVLQQKVTDWRVAKSLERLRAQVNAKAPNRDTAGDGSIGDEKHQTRDSDHNPWVTDGLIGVVTARDITNDPDGGCDAQTIADRMVASKDKRVKYIIWNSKIVSSSVKPWKWRDYTGTNKHKKHMHISVLPDKELYDDETDWSI